MNFKELNLIEPILRAVEEEGYQQPSPIQQQAIPPVLEGRDLLGCAQTGTGKTAAFAIPILQMLSNRPAQGKRNIAALILTPTRELAIQIEESFQAYGRYTPLQYAVIFGGVKQQSQVDKLRKGVDILVATPGRLNDLLNQKLLSLSNVDLFVLDEADRMLDMGFVADVRRIAGRLQKKRQTLLFSATMPPAVERIANTLLTDPVKVAVTPVASTVDTIEQFVSYVDKGNKRHLLAHLLRQPELVSTLVFTRTKYGADRVSRDLRRAGIQALAIHGDKSQNARQKALGDFKKGEAQVLVATDIAARGIDIDELSHVINFDVPESPETYVHRIGRTGRAGLGGTAITFCCYDEMERLRDIEKLIGKDIAEWGSHPYPMEVFTSTAAEPRPPRPPRSRTPYVRNRGRR